MKNEIKHTTHSTYRCQYHIVFAPKYRRKAIYGQLKADIGQILRKLCEQKGVEIIEATAMTDHIHSRRQNLSQSSLKYLSYAVTSISIFNKAGSRSIRIIIYN